MRIRETINWGHPWDGPNKHWVVKIFAVTANSVAIWQQEGQRRSRGSRGRGDGHANKASDWCSVGQWHLSCRGSGGMLGMCWLHTRAPPAEAWPWWGQINRSSVASARGASSSTNTTPRPRGHPPARPSHTDKNNIHLDCECESKCPYSTSEYIVSIFQPWALSECFDQWAFLNLNTGTENWLHTEKVGRIDSILFITSIVRIAYYHTIWAVSIARSLYSVQPM